MNVHKLMLIVDSPGGALAKSAAELRARGYGVVHASDLAAALTAVSTLEKLAIVVVNFASYREGSEAFMLSVRSSHPNLPVIWQGDAHQVVARFLRQPGATEVGTDLDVLTDDATTLLRDRFYANDIVPSLVEAARAVLIGFGVEMTVSEPYIKANLSALSDVNAVLEFAGDGLAGHLLLSASVDRARILFRHWPTEFVPGSDDLEDLMGEVTNQVLGAFKGVFERRALSFELRTPIFVRGPQARYRSKGASPSLAIDFADEGSLFRLELCIDRMRTDGRTSDLGGHALSAGRIHLL